tara:strand:- start:3911 stop:4087 length:177 start_codon:yes stop_codon:yes gene_type:complete
MMGLVEPENTPNKQSSKHAWSNTSNWPNEYTEANLQYRGLIAMATNLYSPIKYKKQIF